MTMHIEVVYSPAPGEVDLTELQLPEGSTLADALQASGVLLRHPCIVEQALPAGVWGRRQPLEHVLRERDRVEVYRALKVDPKEARRQRYRGQKAGGSGASGGRVNGSRK